MRGQAERFDVRLARETGLTRSRAGLLIRQGRACVDGCVQTKPAFPVDPQSRICVDVPPPAAMSAQPEALPLEIVWEDSHLAVVNKPCGMVVHPAAGNEQGTLVNALLYHLQDLSGIGGTLRPGIVHRLDKDTSGLLLVAKDDDTHLALSRMLQARDIHKTYHAVALGGFRDDEGVVEAPVGRHPTDRKRMAVVADGRYARTEYRVLEPLRGATLLEVRLITGRTHQIRVHMAHIGHPLLGDVLYGGKKPRLTAPRLMLHAFRIALTHPITGKALRFEAPEPEAFCAVVQRLRQ